MSSSQSRLFCETRLLGPEQNANRVLTSVPILLCRISPHIHCAKVQLPSDVRYSMTSDLLHMHAAHLAHIDVAFEPNNVEPGFLEERRHRLGSSWDWRAGSRCDRQSCQSQVRPACWPALADQESQTKLRPKQDPKECALRASNRNPTN